MPHLLLDILIIGAGPAGLAAAASLAQDGHAVTVLERHPDLQTRGGNITIQYPAIRCLHHIGITDEALDNVSFNAQGMAFWSYKSDTPFAQSAGHPDPVPRRLSSRPAIQRLAYEAAISHGAKVLFGRRVVSIGERDGRPTVSTDDGGQFSADLLVGVDGIKSLTRKLLFPDEDVAALPTPECIFQTAAPCSDVLNDPVAAPLGAPIHHLTFGPGLYCNGRSSAHGTMRMSFCCFKYGLPEAGEDAIDGTWNTNGDPDEIREIFKNFNGPLHAYIECVARASIPIDKWRIATVPKMKTWLGLGGRALIMGDAAHAMVPHVAQGLSQGIEDGIALSTVLRWAETRDDIPWLMQCWETLRKPRAERMYDTSNENITKFSLPDGPEQEARDERLKNGGLNGKALDWDSVEMNPNAPHGTPPFSKWMMFYNVIEQTNDYVFQMKRERI